MIPSYILGSLLFWISSSFIAPPSLFALNSPSASRAASSQADKTKRDREIIVIYKGSTKDTPAGVSLDGKGKGELKSGTWLAMPASAGSHTIKVTGSTSRTFSCLNASGLYGGTAPHRVERPLQPASITVTLAEQTAYLMINRNNPSLLWCEQLETTPLSDHTVHQIKAKEGERFVKKYQAQVLKEELPSAQGRTMIDMTVDELRQHYSSELKMLEFSQNQDELKPLLSKIGERVQAFFHDFADTSSKETVVLQRHNSLGRLEGATNRNFYYLIVYHPGKDGPSLEEYRTDANNNPINQNAVSGFFMTSGFACLNLYFHPKHQPTLRYRYLGRETTGSRAYVIAFAENLDRKDYLVSFTDSVSGKTTRLAMQGLAWVDPSLYQIVRLQTNLLSAENQPLLTKLVTAVQFSAVRIEAAQEPLWLPREVTVTTVYSGRSFRSLHEYSDYKLFAVKSDYKIAPPKSRN